MSARAGRRAIAAQMAEMVALEALQRERALTVWESERLGLLVSRERARARYRPARIRALRAELALLEALEIGERGAAAVAAIEAAAPAELTLVRGEDGGWSAPARRAA